jgi:hypothetical protein
LAADDSKERMQSVSARATNSHFRTPTCDLTIVRSGITFGGKVENCQDLIGIRTALLGRRHYRFGCALFPFAPDRDTSRLDANLKFTAVKTGNDGTNNNAICGFCNPNSSWTQQLAFRPEPVVHIVAMYPATSFEQLMCTPCNRTLDIFAFSPRELRVPKGVTVRRANQIRFPIRFGIS